MLVKYIACLISLQPLSSSGSGSACIGIACALGADEAFQRAENDSTGVESDNSGKSSPICGPFPSAPGADEHAGISNVAPTGEDSPLVDMITVQEEQEDKMAELKASNETVTTDTSGYVSDVTSLNGACNADMANPAPDDAGSNKPRGLSMHFGPKKQGNSVPKTALKPGMPGIPRSISNPSSVAKPATGSAKQSRLPQQPGRQGGHSQGLQTASRAKAGGFQSRLPALGVKKITRSNPQLHSFGEQQQATTG